MKRTTQKWIPPLSVTGRHVRLEPLETLHEPDLRQAVIEGDLHHLWYTVIPAPDGVAAEIERRNALREAGSMLPFAVIDTRDDRAIGMTTFMNIDAGNRRLEIGSTWYRKSVQRSAVNTECKLLLLTHAFERAGCIAVEFRTHVMNFRSRRAIERLGAKLDGILRSHMIMPNGTTRDTAVYSIIANEWLAVKANLDYLLSDEGRT